MAKTYYITTLGCPKNQADSREMERSLRARGLVPARSLEEADVHIINSCAFVSDAKTETIDTVFEALDYREQKGDQKVVLVGCFSQRYKGAVEEEIPELDLHFGTGLYHETGERIVRRFGWEERLVPGTDPGELLQTVTPPWAPVKISDGCNRGCSFCAIPQFRGPFRDISPEAILEECNRLAREGIREVDLVSQDTGSYGGDPERLLDLLSRIEEVDGIRWIRLLYLYPDAKMERLLRGISERGPGKIVPYLESPVQHISRSVLRAMNRQGNYERYRDLFVMARELFPGLEIRTTFLVGFPGETREEVDQLVRFIHEVRPEKLALFPYSPEEGTVAAALGEAAENAEERINLLRSEHIAILKEIHRDRMDRLYDCMVDEIGDEYIQCHRAQDAPEVDEAVYLPVATTPALCVGDVVKVKITGFYEYDMEGKLDDGKGA